MASPSAGVLSAVVLLSVVGMALSIQCLKTDECMDDFASDAADLGHKKDAYCTTVQRALECLRTSANECVTQEERQYNDRKITEINREITLCGTVSWRSSKLLLLLSLLVAWWIRRV